jgi:hypothetical protein
VAGVERIQRAGGTVPLAMCALLLSGTPAAGADERDASAGIVLASGVMAGLVADLDGDGDGEVIAVLGPPDGAGPLVVQAWAEEAGSWSSLGRVPLVRWDDEDDRPRQARGPDAAGLTTVRTEAGIQVLVPVVATGFESPGGCCLSLSTLSLGPAGLQVELTDSAFGTAESLAVVDLEADGLDELLVTEYVPPDEEESFEAPEARYHLLRQGAAGWERSSLPLDQETGPYLALAAETDGVPGDDLIFVHSDEPFVVRLAVEGGELRPERVVTDLIDQQVGSWFAAATDGVLVVVDGAGLATAEWPRGGLPVRINTTSAVPYPTVFLFGEGLDARLVELTDNGMQRDGGRLGLRVYGLDLELQEEIDAPPLAQELWEMNSSGLNTLAEHGYRLYPQLGPIPGGLRGEPALLGAGALLTIAQDGSLTVREAQPLVGATPIGFAGEQSDWLASGPGWFGLSSTLYLSGGFSPDAAISVLPLESVLDADPTPGDWSLAGATPTSVAGEEVLATGGEGFTATVGGAPGTLVISSIGQRVAATEVADGPVTVTLEPGRGEENEQLTASIVTVSPTGLASSESWEVAVYRQPPAVTAASESELFSLRSAISGQVSPGTSLTVDGQSVELTAGGSYDVEVDAPAWPREVLVVARDPVGNETVERLEVIGFVDYRGLPWIPIVGVLTVVAGIVLFVRTPNIRPEARLAPDGDGRLEEIDGDLV